MSSLTPGCEAQLVKVRSCITRVFDVDPQYCQRRQPHSPIFNDQSKGKEANTKAPKPHVLVNLTDNIGSIWKFAAAVVARESVRVVRIIETVDMHGCPVDCNASQIVNFGKSFRDSKPTTYLRLRSARHL